MNKQEILKKTGRVSQICGAREMQCTSGKAAGTRFIQVYNGALEFGVTPDKCMDIFDLRYRGVNFSFQTKNGLVGNQFYSALNDEFSDYWSAGMMCTCGLENTGQSGVADGRMLPLHGRIGMTPAENVCVKQYWDGDDYKLHLSGQMRETRVDGHDLLLTRNIITSMYSNEVTIRDTLENQDVNPFEFMILYHTNFGYPFIDKETEFDTGGAAVTPRTQYAAGFADSVTQFEDAIDNEEEKVFFHDVRPGPDGMSKARIVNPRLGLGAEIEYSYDTLPILTQWKSYRSGDYVMGVEPGNSYIMGRAEETDNGTIKTIAAGETLEFKVILKFFED